MKVLITGAGGFLGSYFARHLDHDVHAFDRTQLDLNDSHAVKSKLQAEQYDVILHCASAGRNTARSVDPEIAINNLGSFANLVANRHEFGMLINFASGAEFDIESDINCVNESEIWSRNPMHSYGRSKNLISRQVQMLPDFYNLRIFGCFDASEGPNRPLKALSQQLKNGEPFVVPADREFDMVGVADILTVVRAVMAKHVSDKDLNLVYNHKYTLSEILKMFARLHNFDPELIQVSATDSKNYTGSGRELHKYNLNLLGLERSLLNYTL